jgi:hypothetical protein
MLKNATGGVIIASLPIMHLESLLPTLPRELLWPEAARMAGVGRFAASGTVGSRVWSLECPLHRSDPRLSVTYGQDRTAEGLQFEAAVQHTAVMHIGQAAGCFRAAISAAERSSHYLSAMDVRTKSLELISWIESTHLAPYSRQNQSDIRKSLSLHIRRHLPYLQFDTNAVLHV